MSSPAKRSASSKAKATNKRPKVEKKEAPTPAASSSGPTDAADEWVTIPAAPADPKWDTPANANITARVRKSDLAYDLKPLHYGPKVIRLNAQDPAFYARSLPNAKITIWVLSCVKTAENVIGHVKQRLWEAARSKNVAVRFMHTNKFELFATKDGLDYITYDGQPISPPDVVIPRVGAKVDYFGLSVIRQLEMTGALVLNGFQSINVSRDKLYTMQHAASHGILIPKTLLAKFPIDSDLLEREFEYPFILKKASGSQGKGIMKIESREQLEDVADMLDSTDPLIFQEFLHNSSGRDLRVLVVGGRVVASMMRIAQKGFKANVHQGGRVKLVTLQPQVEWMVLETVKLLNLDIAGVDLLIDKTSYKLCEVNSSPGFDGLENATGIDVAGSMIEYAKVRAGVWRLRKKSGKGGLQIPVQADHQAD